MPFRCVLINLKFNFRYRSTCVLTCVKDVYFYFLDQFSFSLNNSNEKKQFTRYLLDSPWPPWEAACYPSGLVPGRREWQLLLLGLSSGCCPFLCIRNLRKAPNCTNRWICCEIHHVDHKRSRYMYFEILYLSHLACMVNWSLGVGSVLFSDPTCCSRD